MMEQFVTATNSYAVNTNRSRWIELTVSEFKLYLGLVMLMGAVPLPSQQNYWIGPLAQPFVNTKMLYQRFCDIRLCLHYEDASQFTEAEQKANKRDDPF